MHKVKLFKISSNHANVRTDTIDGQTWRLPVPGERFQMHGKGLELEGSMRMLLTTPVLEMAVLGDTTLFRTQNSTYCVQVLKPVEKPA
jgi:hypothetical protein